MKRSILSILAAPLCLLFAQTGCSDGDMDYHKDVIIVTGTGSVPVVTFPVDDTPATFSVTAQSTKKAPEDIVVQFKLDPGYLDEYNRINASSYVLVPEGSVKITVPEEIDPDPDPSVDIPETMQAVITAGNSASTPLNVQVVSTEDMIDGVLYVIPLTITSTTSSDMEILQASRTILLRLSRPVEFASLDLSMNGQMNNNNNSMYSNFIFDDSKKVTMTAFTYEFKCFINAWNPNASNRLSRLIQFTAKDEAKGSMIRFSENGYPMNSVQWVNPGGSIVPPSTFNFRVWYHFSLVYDGVALAMYIDGQKVGEVPWAGNSVDFQRLELGMSWENYRNRQAFNGRLCEVRVWNKALTAGQINLGKCGVDPASEGLVAYWKFNQSSGTTFIDETGHGYDMDWTKVVRQAVDGGPLINDVNAYRYIYWLQDDENKCYN